LHLLLEVRASSLLALRRNREAAGDVLTGLRLARLARQNPDTRSNLRVQWMLARSLQPLWEGLAARAWTEPELASLQHELAGFDLLADYTNAIRRVVFAHIELWRVIPGHTNAYAELPGTDEGRLREPAWRLQPRTWWFDACIQLYEAGQTAIGQVDAVNGRFSQANNWPDVNGLPLDSASTELFQQNVWWGATPATVAFAQTSLNQAVIACALERFRQLHGAYPRTSEELVPALLPRIPHDAVSGRPVIYQTLEDGGFILRGVGPNGTDDRKSPSSDDWLWTYSTNTPSAKK